MIVVTTRQLKLSDFNESVERYYNSKGDVNGCKWYASSETMEYMKMLAPGEVEFIGYPVEVCNDLPNGVPFFFGIDGSLLCFAWSLCSVNSGGPVL